MRRLWQILSYCGLALTLGPSFLVFAGRLAWGTHAQLMAVGMVLWFISRPLAVRPPLPLDKETIK